MQACCIVLWVDSAQPSSCSPFEFVPSSALQEIPFTASSARQTMQSPPRTPGRPPRGRVLPVPGKPPSPQTGVKSPSQPPVFAPPRAPAASDPRPRGVPAAQIARHAGSPSNSAASDAGSRTSPSRSVSPASSRPAAGRSPRGPRGVLAAAGKAKSLSDLNSQKATPPAVRMAPLNARTLNQEVRILIML